MATAPVVGRAAAAAAAAVLASVPAACSGSEADKAGGPTGGRPMALTLGAWEPLYAAEFVKAVGRLSDGTIRVKVKALRGRQVEHAKTVGDVRAGRLDLALVPARSWDTLGVTSFRALLAPFLVDSLALEARVLEGALASRMLEGVERIGLFGVAVVPGALRRPLGVSRPLVGLADYEGATIGMGPGRVAQETFRVLKAKGKRVTFPMRYYPRWTTGLDGSEVDLRTALTTSQASSVTANVVFWPEAQTIVASREALESLDPGQRELLRRAGRQAVRPLVTLFELDESQLLSFSCGPAMSPVLVTAPAGELAAVHRAVEPVYTAIARDRSTRGLIAEIRKIRRAMASRPGQLACPAARSWVKPGRSALDGRWRATLTRKELLAAGESSQQVDECPMCTSVTLDFEKGRVTATLGRAESFWSGAFTVEGHVLRVKVQTCSPDPCPPFADEYTWSRYRDTLSFAPVRGRAFWPVMVAGAFRRVR
jgi:TRAP-type C4-dicarboxylate transport system substrate-binding protein